VRVRAAGKINLFLSVGPPRRDGYHGIRSVMQGVSLWDEMEIVSAASGFTLSVEGAALPVDDGNLVLRAAWELSRRSGREGAAIKLRKRIPVAAGLGGGSADAAGALLGLDRLLGLGLGPEGLLGAAATIGSDVPFCLYGDTALAEGRGERLQPRPSGGSLWWVLGVAGVGSSTRDVYARFDEMGAGATGLADPSYLLEALAVGDLEGVACGLRNDLEAPAFDLRPELAEAKRSVLDAGAVAASMSGSGPTMMGLARSEPHARELASAVVGEFLRVEVVHSPVAGVDFF